MQGEKVDIKKTSDNNEQKYNVSIKELEKEV